MGNPLDAASVSSDNDHQSTVPARILDSTATALQDLQIDDTFQDAGETGRFPGEGRTFVVDPNVFAQWNAGQDAVLRDGVADGDLQPTSPPKEDKLPNGQETSAADTSMELGVNSTKKSSKKKKPKSKRGLVQHPKCRSKSLGC